VGRALVEAAEEWAVRLNLDVVVVRSNQLRVQARGFYEHLGYAVTKTQNAFRKTLS
jgi:GNAT superfamily N-acetyltransferase